MNEEMFKNYRSKVVKEGWLKSLFCGFLIAFLLLTVLGGVFWFIEFKYYWIAFIAFGVAFGVSTVLFYKLKYQPTAKKVARRVDELGLEERIITMQELEKDNSYIAKRQREDALAALNKVSASMIKIIVSVPLIVGVAVSAFAGIGMSVMSALAAHGVIGSGLDAIKPEEGVGGDKVYYEVYYEVQEGEGVIEGETYQKVAKGESTTGVLALPDDEWMFLSWSDGYEDPYREDVVEGDLTIYAIFQPIEENGGFPGEGDESGGQNGMPMDVPGEGDGDGSGDGDPTENPNKSGGGKYEDVNQVIDNNTFYGDIYDGAYEDAIGQIGGDDYSSDEKDMVGGYFDGIELGESEDGN